MNTFWSFLGLMFWLFVFVAYLMVLFTILADLFRDERLSGWWKAVWVIFLIFVPFLTALVYLIARGNGMAQRSRRDRGTVAEDTDYYVHPTPSATPAADIEQAKALLERGVISANEFDALKAKALGERF